MASTSVTVDVLGAGREVGRSCIVVTFTWSADVSTTSGNSSTETLESRVMFDCGVHVGQKDVSLKFPDFRQYLKLPADTPNEKVGKALSEKIDLVVVTHMHLDHVGALPYLTEKLGFDSPVVTSPPTKSLGALLLADYLRNVDAADEAGAANRNDNVSYNCRPGDAFASLGKAQAINLGETMFFNPRNLARQASTAGLISEAARRIEIRAHLAGHVLGAVMFEVNYAGARVLYTGDYNTNTDRLICRTDIPTLLRPDVLISEGTYAIHVKDNRSNVEREMCRVILTTLRGNGKVLVPCFSIGKAQEIASTLLEFLRECKAAYPIYIGGLMARRGISTYQQFADWSRASPSRPNTLRTHKNTDSLDIDDDVDWADTTVGPIYRLASSLLFLENDEEFIKSDEPGVLFAAPAMLNGGLSQMALREWSGSPKNLIVMTGSCVPGTIGNKLVIGQKTVQTGPRGLTLNITCKVRYFPFANHVGYFGLRKIVELVDPVSIVFVHGDAEGVFTLGTEIASELGIPVWCPKNFESFDIPLDKWREHKQKSLAIAAQSLPVMDVSERSFKEASITVAGSLPSTQEAIKEPVAFCLRMSPSLFADILQPPISAINLLTNPPMWPGALEWLESLGLSDGPGVYVGSPISSSLDSASPLSSRASPSAISDVEDGEMLEEEGCLSDDDETTTAAISLSCLTGASSSFDFSDARHETAFKMTMSRHVSKPSSESMKDSSCSLLARLQGLKKSRPVVRLSGWASLTAFRDLVVAMESMSDQTVYCERKGFGVLVFYTLGLTVLVAANAETVSTLVNGHDAQVETMRLHHRKWTPSKLGAVSFTSKTASEFYTPMLVQLGKLELSILLGYKQNTNVPLRVSFWHKLTGLYLTPAQLAELQKPLRSPLPEPSLLWNPRLVSAPTPPTVKIDVPSTLPPPPPKEVISAWVAPADEPVSPPLDWAIPNTALTPPVISEPVRPDAWASWNQSDWKSQIEEELPATSEYPTTVCEPQYMSPPPDMLLPPPATPPTWSQQDSRPFGAPGYRQTQQQRPPAAWEPPGVAWELAPPMATPYTQQHPSPPPATPRQAMYSSLPDTWQAGPQSETWQSHSPPTWAHHRPQQQQQQPFPAQQQHQQQHQQAFPAQQQQQHQQAFPAQQQNYYGHSGGRYPPMVAPRPQMPWQDAPPPTMGYQTPAMPQQQPLMYHPQQQVYAAAAAAGSSSSQTLVGGPYATQDPNSAYVSSAAVPPWAAARPPMPRGGYSSPPWMNR